MALPRPFNFQDIVVRLQDQPGAKKGDLGPEDVVSVEKRIRYEAQAGGTGISCKVQVSGM